MKFIKLQKRHGGEIFVNPEHITNITTYSYRNDHYNGHLSFFTVISFDSGEKIEVLEVDEYILELIKL